MSSSALLELLIGVAAVALFTIAAWAIVTVPFIFDSDEYLHAKPALELSVALKRLDLPLFFEILSSEGFYPPFPPLVYSLFFLPLDPTVASARLPSLLFFGIAILLVLRAVRSIRGDSNGSFVAAATSGVTLAALTNPTAVFTSLLCMIEPIGMTLVACMLYLLARTRDPFCSVRVSLLLFIAVIALLMSKYTFPALLLPGLGLALLFDAQSWRILARRVSLYLAGVTLTGAVFLLWTYVAPWEAIRGYLIDYPARGIAIGLNHQSYYLRLLFTEYAWSPLTGTVIIVLAAVATVRCWSMPAVRFAALSLCCSMVLMGFVAERSPRHILILMPLLWFLVGVGVAVLLSAVRSRRIVGLLQVGLALITVLVTASAVRNARWLDRELRLTMEHRPQVYEVHRGITTTLDTNPGTLLIGRSAVPLAYSLNWEIAAARGVLLRELTSVPQLLRRDESRALSSAATATDIVNIIEEAERSRGLTGALVFLPNARLHKAETKSLLDALCTIRRCTAKGTKHGRLIHSHRREDR